jgi:phospholipid/cholesterol/gamma-HCH transport system substrate-binding protein
VNEPNPVIRQVVLAIGAATAAILIVLLITSGGNRYSLRMVLPNASGLQSGSAVKIGGAGVGSVSSIDIGKDDQVHVTLSIDTGDARVTSATRIAIRSENLLGDKFVDVQTPAGGRQLPSGSTIPASRITFPVDLDQVLGVLDGNTRTRLAILINEAGLALSGRHADFNSFLQMAPPAFDRITNVLDRLSADNSALGQLVLHSSRIVGDLAVQRRALLGTIDVAGKALETVAQRRASLRATLAAAPATLTSLRRFLSSLQSTTVPLGPAARLLATTAPALRATLAQLEPFRMAAKPALAAAQSVAPLLTRLGVQAAPVISSSLPTVSELATFAQASPPLTSALGASIDNIMGAVQGWARAIQGRDSIGHLFRGHLSLDAEMVKSVLSQLPAFAPIVAGRRYRAAQQPLAHPPTPAVAPAAPAATPAPTAASAPPPAGAQPLQGLPKIVGGLLGTVLSGVAHRPPPSGQPSGTTLSKLLGFLLKP